MRKVHHKNSQTKSASALKIEQLKLSNNIYSRKNPIKSILCKGSVHFAAYRAIHIHCYTADSESAAKTASRSILPEVGEVD